MVNKKGFIQVAIIVAILAVATIGTAVYAIHHVQAQKALQAEEKRRTDEDAKWNNYVTTLLPRINNDLAQTQKVNEYFQTRMTQIQVTLNDAPPEYKIGNGPLALTIQADQNYEIALQSLVDVGNQLVSVRQQMINAISDKNQTALDRLTLQEISLREEYKNEVNASEDKRKLIKEASLTSSNN
jgi:recombinational DNA repair ATPase RecF